jgi:uncharacterized membrane protein YgcG
MNKRFAKQTILALMTLLATLLTSLTHVTAQDAPFFWDAINVDMNVQSNGDMLITETHKYVFPTKYNNQRFRYIPLDKIDKITDVTVQENNRVIPSQTGIENGQFRISWQHKLKPPSKHTFVIKYRVVGGLQVDSQNTQVYWKAIFADRKAPIKTAIVRVQLPKSLSGKVLSFQSFGALSDAREINSTTFEFIAKAPILPQEELEVQITLESGTINFPLPQWQQSSEQTGTNTEPPKFFSYLFGILLMLLFIFSRLFSSKSSGGGIGNGDGGGGGSGGDGGGGGGGG